MRLMRNNDPRIGMLPFENVEIAMIKSGFEVEIELWLVDTTKKLKVKNATKMQTEGME
jgi:hypothetical protein